MSLLDIDRVTLKFGGLTAVKDLSFAVEEGQVFALVGPNGAGKSTVFNLISRFYTPAAGAIRFAGQDLLRLHPHQVPARGIARTFQNIELFHQATVLQNLLVGRHRHRRAGLAAQLLHLPSMRAEERAHRLAVEEVIDFLDLQPYRDARIAGLPYGVRKVVELGRALASKPRMLLLDEPASGLSVEETQNMRWWIDDIRRQMGITVLMVEHDMGLVGKVSDRVLALADGARLAEGTPAEVQAHPAVIAAYLGTGPTAKAAAHMGDVAAGGGP
ncbi:ABC transporter ATP-binding protein [Ruixingdingia sedimenti]|uniref:ABC transporter ATP-binding protein n=1 Tax=Ruixingdingia sedimenti TaxID=3073604 RepID=A0ABU1F315_9RHOB|nr:ABC transporter ATP-binding protein [Xinfangfangia sp. LG-4]MDR5651013.1 ABC transporter ATP-binding protein [Xinfangfangia sp. LG-4]